jgi:hypothetical protein
MLADTCAIVRRRRRGSAMTSSVSTRGQITIDRQAREALSIEPGMEAVQIVVDGHLEVYFLPARHNRSLLGVLPPREPVSIEDWDRIREGAADAIAADALRKL